MVSVRKWFITSSVPIAERRIITMISVSCIIPIYNAGSFLESTIQLNKDQKLSEIQIICVDDCSDENSLEI